MTSAFVSAFVLAFSTFLPVINPFSGATFFCTLTTPLGVLFRSHWVCSSDLH